MNASDARPRRLRKLMIALLILLALAAGLIAALPALVSGPGRGLVLGQVNAALAGRIALAELELGWSGPQRIAGLEVFEADGGRVLAIGSIEIDASLFGLIRRPHCRGQIVIRDVTGDIAIGADGSTNLSRVAAGGESAAAPAAERARFDALRGMDCRIRIESAEIDLDASGMEPVRVSNLKANAHLDGLDAVRLDLAAEVVQGQSRGRLESQAEVDALFDARGRLQPAQAGVDFTLEMERFPVDMIDRLAGQSGRLSAVLGDSLEQRVRGEWRGREGRLKLDMQSSAGAEAEIELALRGATIGLERPARIVFSVRPEAWPVLAPEGATLVRSFAVDARLDALTFDPQSAVAALDARLAIGDIELTADDPQIGRLALRQTRLGLASEDLREGLILELDTVAEQGVSGQGEHRGRARLEGRVTGFLASDLTPTPDKLGVELDGRLSELPLAVFDQLAGSDGLLPATLGARMNAEFFVRSRPDGGEFNLIVQSAHLRAGASGKMDADGLELDRGRVALQLQPAVVARFTDAPVLAEPAGLEVQFTRLHVPRGPAGLDFDQAAIDVTGELSETRARFGDGGEPVHIAGTLNAGADRLGDGLSLEFDGRLGDGRSSGRLSLSAPLDGAFALRAPARAELSDFPTAIVDRIAGQDGRLPALLGDSMALKLILTPHADGALDVGAELDSALLETRLQAAYRDGRLSVASGAEMDWTLTPEAFAVLQAEPAWALVRPAAVAFRLERLRMDLNDGGPDLRTLELAAEARMPDLQLRREDGTILRFGAMNLIADGRPLGERLDLRANAELAGGRFHSESALFGAVGPDGGFAPGEARIETETRFDDVPSELVLAVADLDPALGPALGRSIQTRISGTLPGDLDVSASGANTRVDASANLDADGILRLNRDAELSLNVTPALIDGYLSRMHPFLNDVRSAEQPIRVVLQGEGFELPLTGYRPEAIRADGRLEIGTLNMNRGAITLGLFGALQRLGGNVPAGSTFQARFTPLQFSARDGVVETNDLWMQMDRLMLGALATIRLPEQLDATPWASVVFAVPGQTLRGLPRIADSIAPDTILTTSAEGPLGEISPDFQKVFAGLAAQSAIGRVAGQSEVGQALGGLLGSAMGGRREQAPQQGRPVQGDARSRWPNMPPIETGAGQQQQR